ncbi:hypothetical protein ES705_23896 [subsurface metagenome]
MDDDYHDVGDVNTADWLTQSKNIKNHEISRDRHETRNQRIENRKRIAKIAENSEIA